MSDARIQHPVGSTYSPPSSFQSSNLSQRPQINFFVCSETFPSLTSIADNNLAPFWASDSPSRPHFKAQGRAQGPAPVAPPDLLPTLRPEPEALFRISFWFVSISTISCYFRRNHSALSRAPYRTSRPLSELRPEPKAQYQIPFGFKSKSPM